MSKKLSSAIILALALAASAQAADTSGSCKLKGGSIVPLPAEACAKEGGAVVTAAAAAASAPAPTYQLSADPRLAAAQKAALVLLSKPVVGKITSRGSPEGVERSAKFADCTMTVEENLQVDYGNVLSSRKIFKISSTVDFRNLPREQFGELGEISSMGGLLKAYAVYLEKSRKPGDYLAISISDLYEGNYRKFRPGQSAYWDAPRDDFWMADEYGYVVADSMGNTATSKVRILYIVSSADDAAALKKAFDEISAVCRKQ
ncbi:MAG TPA: hypothetical protein VIU46_09935 [Gallionellaceae bacterium]